MRILKTFLTLLLVSISVLAVFGISWWTAPPEKLAAGALGAQVILGLTILGSGAGVWRLWTPE